MKKFALAFVMVVVFVVSASMAMSATLYSPWLIDTMNSTDPGWGSFNTLIFVYNTTDSTATGVMTLRKFGAAATSTTINISVPAKDVVFYSFNALCQTPTNWYDAANPNAPVRRGTMELVEGTAGSLIGFTFRNKANYIPTYSEPLFVK